MGYIDRAGTYVIPAAFITAGAFSGGLAPVEYDVRKWGFINPSGDIRAVDAYSLRPFVGGYARFENEDMLEGFLDIELRVVVPPVYQQIQKFEEGLAWARENIRGERTYFVNPRGERVLTFDVPCERAFTFGRLAVRIGRRWGFVDKTGEMVIPPLFEATWYGFFDGLAAVRLDGEWGFVDLEGDMVIEPRFDEVMGFCGGLAAVRVGTLWGYVNASGDMIIEPRFDTASSFLHGLASVQIDGLWGYVNITGELVIEPRFLDVGDFYEGLARAEILSDLAAR